MNKQTMTWDEAMHWIARCASNITEGHTVIEAGSTVHRAMEELCRLNLERTQRAAAVARLPALERIEKTYHGKADACCCGCSGRYTETRRGIRRGLQEMGRAIMEGGTVDTDDTYVAVELGGRVRIAYLRDEAKAVAS